MQLHQLVPLLPPPLFVAGWYSTIPLEYATPEQASSHSCKLYRTGQQQSFSGWDSLKIRDPSAFLNNT